MDTVPAEQREVWAKVFAAAGGEEAFAALAQQYLKAPRRAGAPDLIAARRALLLATARIIRSDRKIRLHGAATQAVRAAMVEGMAGAEETLRRWVQANFQKVRSELYAEIDAEAAARVKAPLGLHGPLANPVEALAHLRFPLGPVLPQISQQLAELAESGRFTQFAEITERLQVLFPNRKT